MRRLVYLLFLASATAHAQLVTIDAGAHPTGTNLYSVAAGARVFSLTNNNVAGTLVFDPVVAVANTWATGAGANFFGHNNIYPLVLRHDFRGVFDLHACLDGWCPDEFFNPLVVTFNVPTNFIEVRAHFLPDDIDGAVLRAYNAAGDILYTCQIPGARSTPPPPTFACGTFVRRYDCNRSGTRCKHEYLARIQRSYPDVAYVFYGGQSYTATRSAITTLTFRRYSETCDP